MMAGIYICCVVLMMRCAWLRYGSVTNGEAGSWIDDIMTIYSTGLLLSSAVVL